MADITKCKGNLCPMKESCFRYLAKDGAFMQSYYVEVPYDKDNNNCEHYWGIKNENDLRRANRDWED